MTDIRKIFEFTTYLEGFKKIERFVGQHFWKDYPHPLRYESDADHTWRMAMMLVVIEKRLSRPIDFAKAMKMLLIHDVPEIIAGDASPLGTDGTGKDSHAYNTDMAEAKFEREKEAAEEIFGKLPKEEAEALYALWLEYEDQASYEAKVIKALDRFEGKLQTLEYTNGVIFKEHLAFAETYGTDTFNIDPALKELEAVLLEEFHAKFKEFKVQS